MEAFYVSIIFLGVLLVLGSLFFIAMDKVNGKDFFKEFDRKKEEMFNLIQDSEEMVQELNRMSDYVVTVIAEKNQEFFNKSASLEKTFVPVLNESKDQVEEILILPSPQETIQSEIAESTLDVEKEPEVQRLVNMQFSHNIESVNKESSVNEKSKLVLNSRRREVLKLIEQGLSNDEIADKLKIGKGEIGLIRGLSK